MVEYFTVNKNLTFILTDTKILVKTPLQTSLIVYMNGNYRRQWIKLREDIQNNRIKSISQLIDYNRPRIGGISQVQGLLLLNTQESRHV